MLIGRNKFEIVTVK